MGWRIVMVCMWRVLYAYWTEPPPAYAVVGLVDIETSVTRGPVYITALLTSIEVVSGAWASSGVACLVGLLFAWGMETFSPCTEATCYTGRRRTPNWILSTCALVDLVTRVLIGHTLLLVGLFCGVAWQFVSSRDIDLYPIGDLVRTLTPVLFRGDTNVKIVNMRFVRIPEEDEIS